MEELVITENSERADTLLARHLGTSRSYVQFLFENDAVFLNGKICKKRMIPVAGQKLTYERIAQPELSAAPEAIPLDILYEDESLLVVNKGKGMAVHPAPGSPSGTLVNALLHHFSGLPVMGDPLRPGIVHRLDKDTTGCIVIAKTRAAHEALGKQFADRSVRKEYIALCYGVPKEGLFEAPIGRHKGDRKKMAVCEDGKPASSTITILERRDKLTLVSVLIHTGRTHQIRVHLKALNAPILGDPIYGIDHINKKFDIHSPQLHAYRLSFTHPKTGQKLSFEAPKPF